MGKVLLNLKPSPLESRLQIANINNGDFHSTVRRTLLCSRLIGLLPLSGLSSPTSDKLRFTLRSPYTIVYAISLFGQCSMFLMSFYWFLQKEFSLPNITTSLFYTASITSSIVLMDIGRHWPQVIAAVEGIERTLPPFSRNITKICNTTLVIILLAAIVEHLLSVYYGVMVAYACDSNNVMETFFRFNMPWVFDYTSYSLCKALLIETFNIQSTFMWSFNDLLIMIISIYLTEHIIMHNMLLTTAVKQEHFRANEFRVQYLNIVRLVRLLNGQVGIYILTSFGSNLYWICTQLFYSLNKTGTAHFIACHNETPRDFETLLGIEHTIYFTFSFTFIVLRTLLVLLLAARIHSNSNIPLTHLFGLPSEKFDVEVERFISQIRNIKVALSGLDFFYVTRSTILTLFGTILTYELVLFQLNN